MLTGKRFILCGLSRLTIRVARSLAASHADVTLIRIDREDEERLVGLSTAIHTLQALGVDLAEILRTAGVTEATCVLALADDDLDNLRIAVAAREVAPDVPVVLRAFDPVLADQLEQGLNVRRAYSVSALAAPAFVAAACGDQVIETMRLGNGEVPLSRLIVGPNSPLINLTTSEVKDKFGCAILARCADPAPWCPALGQADGAPLRAGEQILIGGTLPSVLRLGSLNSGFPRERTRRIRLAKRQNSTTPPKKAFKRHTRLPLVAATLVGLLLTSVAVFSITLKLSLVDTIYFVVTTATTTGYGDISLKDAPAWLKLFGCLVMLSGAALLGVLFSYFSALATAERLDEVMGKRARKLTNHVVVAGLGNLGYRVAGHFIDLGWDVAVIEMSPHARFVEAMRTRCAVLNGDSRLPDNLDRASISRAAAFVACTDDDLANIQACLHARRLNPTITTVARVFDDILAQRLCHAFEIDHALSATQCAVGAYIGAATDEQAMRPFQVGELEFLAFRYSVTMPLSQTIIDGWREHGVRLVAVRSQGHTPTPPQARPELCSGDEAILCGPASAIRKLFVV